MRLDHPLVGCRSGSLNLALPSNSGAVWILPPHPICRPACPVARSHPLADDALIAKPACVLEYLLRCGMDDGSNVIVCDFDPYLMDRAKAFFPEIIAKEFDFFTGDVFQKVYIRP